MIKTRYERKLRIDSLRRRHTHKDLKNIEMHSGPVETPPTTPNML